MKEGNRLASARFMPKNQSILTYTGAAKDKDKEHLPTHRVRTKASFTNPGPTNTTKNK